MRPIVLVHGSFCGGWVWKHLSPILRSKGHEVYTPTLTHPKELAKILMEIAQK